MKNVSRHFYSLFVSSAIVGVYFLAANLGLSFAFTHDSVSPVWPPTGIALAALLFFGLKYWPSIFIGAFVSNYALTSAGLVVSAFIGVGNLIEAVVGAYLVQRFIPSGNYFLNLREVTKFFLLGCVLGPAVSATIGVTAISIADGDWSTAPLLWFTWWIGDVGGAILIVPWLISIREAPRAISSMGILHYAILTAVAGAACFLTFGPPAYPIAFIHIPILIWAAVNFLHFGASTLVLLVSLAALWGTALGYGQFSGLAPNTCYLMLQVFVITAALTAELVAALIVERRANVLSLMLEKEVQKLTQERFRQLAENIREVFYIADVELRGFLYLSPTIETIWKKRPEDFYGKTASFLDTVHPDDQEIFKATMKKRQQGEATTTEYRIILPGGEVSWILDRAFPIRNEQGHVYRFGGIAEDITLRREVDAELRRKAEDLARANQELERFASIASHDLKAPIRTISSYIQLLQRQYLGKFDSKADEYIGFIADSCKRMHQLIEDILRSARLGGKTLEQKSFSLQKLAEEVCADLTGEIDSAGARVEVRTLPDLVGDATQFREVIQNLIGNAIKFRSAAPPEITLFSSRERDGWRIAVRDNGIGISEGASKRIFESFVRLHPVTSYEGSGIGLATCKRVVGQRGGRIWVVSEKGRGATFYFTVPDNVPGDDDTVENITPIVAPATVDKSLTPVFEILMVEDSPGDSNVMEILLRKEPFPFHLNIAKDGEEGIAFLRRLGPYANAPRPSLILLDLNLPGLDGTEVLKEIKADPDLRSIPVIVITASVREEDIRTSYELSAACCIRKPHDLAGFRDMLTLLRKFWFEQAQLPSTDLPIAAPIEPSQSLPI